MYINNAEHMLSALVYSQLEPFLLNERIILMKIKHSTLSTFLQMHDHANISTAAMHNTVG